LQCNQLSCCFALLCNETSTAQPLSLNGVLLLSCRWVRMGGELDLLDAPGIIPAAFNDQAAAQALAVCNDIGEASYVDSLIAAAMIIRIKALPRNRCAALDMQQRLQHGAVCASVRTGLVYRRCVCKLDLSQLAVVPAGCRMHSCCM
jgi:hypothetical protein